MPELPTTKHQHQCPALWPWIHHVDWWIFLCYPCSQSPCNSPCLPLSEWWDRSIPPATVNRIRWAEDGWICTTSLWSWDMSTFFIKGQNHKLLCLWTNKEFQQKSLGSKPTSLLYSHQCLYKFVTKIRKCLLPALIYSLMLTGPQDRMLPCSWIWTCKV